MRPTKRLSLAQTKVAALLSATEVGLRPAARQAIEATSPLGGALGRSTAILGSLIPTAIEVTAVGAALPCTALSREATACMVIGRAVAGVGHLESGRGQNSKATTPPVVADCVTKSQTL